MSMCKCGHSKNDHTRNGNGYCFECECEGFYPEREVTDEDYD